MKPKTILLSKVTLSSFLILLLLTQPSQAQEPKGKARGETRATDSRGVDLDTLALNTTAEPDLDPSGMVQLFNGKDLTGWSVKGGPMPFTVEDGEIVGICDPKVRLNAFLSTDQTYRDFLFTAEYQWEVPSNSGVMFRAATRPMDEKEIKKAGTSDWLRVFGYQCEVETSDRGWTGGIYGEAMGGWKYPLAKEKEHAEARAAVKDLKSWNRVTILAKGDRILTWINGIPCANLNNQERADGFIALQVHQGRVGKIRWRNLRIRELPRD